MVHLVLMVINQIKIGQREQMLDLRGTASLIKARQKRSSWGAPTSTYNFYIYIQQHFQTITNHKT